MALAHGHSISAEEIERLVSREFTPVKFAALCNAVSWALSGRKCGSLPSFTERVNVRDDGIDVEWQVAFPDGDFGSPLLGSGLNIFQYKQRDIFADNRARVFSRMKSGLAGAVHDILERTGNRPDRYVLFTSLDLTHDQKAELREAILDGYDQPDGVRVEIVGAGELAAFLNALPHIRSGYFATANFVTWQQAWDDHCKKTIYGTAAPLIGRGAEQKQIEALLSRGDTRVVVLSGLPEVGKTRLALESTKKSPVDTVVAFDSKSLTLADLVALEGPGDVVIVIENPDLTRLQAYIEHAVTRPKLKLLVTLTLMPDAVVPNFGRDPRVQVFPIKPLSDEDVRELMKQATNLDFNVQDWIVEQAGGCPGILIVALSLGAELTQSAASFAEDVARSIEAKVRREFGEPGVKTLRLLSVMSRVGIRAAAYSEIETVCSCLGGDPNEVMRLVRPLERAGLVNVQGGYAEVFPLVLTKHLAASVLAGQFDGLCRLIAALDVEARNRLFHRLAILRSPEAERFWSELFAAQHVFGGLPSALKNIDLFRIVAGAVPFKAAKLLLDGLSAMSIDERKGISATDRGHLAWILEELLCRRQTAEQALRASALLADAEDEKERNNTRSLFCGALLPGHPQVALPLSVRFRVFRELCGGTRERIFLGIDGVEAAFNPMGWIMARHSTGAEPLDGRPVTRWGDVRKYMDELVEWLFVAAQSKDDAISDKACDVLPDVLSNYALQARPEEGVNMLAQITRGTLDHRLPVPVTKLNNALRFASESLDGLAMRTEEEDQSEAEERADKLRWISMVRASADLARNLQTELEGGDFSIRLKRWAGKWGRGEHDRVQFEGSEVDRIEKELVVLAIEAITDERKLSDDLLDWLASTESQKARPFLSYLGERDSKRRCLDRIEARYRKDAKTSGLLAFYLGGLSKADRAFVSERLDAFVGSGETSAEAIVDATGFLAGDSAGVARMRTLLEQKRIDPAYVGRTLSWGGWGASLDPADFFALLRAIADDELKHPMAVIDMLGMWLHNKKPIEGDLADFAWRCLESVQNVSSDIMAEYHCDVLAGELAMKDPARGLRLLDGLLLQEGRGHRGWWPIDPRGGKTFWNALHAADARGALNTALDRAAADRIQAHWITSDMRALVDQEQDGPVLMEYAMRDDIAAKVVCDCLASSQPGFWPIALRIIERYPYDERIRSRLMGAILSDDLGVGGLPSMHLEESRRQIQSVIDRDSTPPAARTWLECVADDLRQRAETSLISEFDEQGQ